MSRYEEALTFPDLFKSESSIKSETSSGQHYEGANIFYESDSYLNSPLLVLLDQSISVSFSSLIEI